MKRQVLIAAIGALFALPAFANYEIDAGYPPIPHATGKSSAQVRQELVDAKQSGYWPVNAELGTVSRPAQATVIAGKSRGQVRAELERAYRDGEIVANAELGTTIGHL